MLDNKESLFFHIVAPPPPYFTWKCLANKMLEEKIFEASWCWGALFWFVEMVGTTKCVLIMIIL